MRVYKYPLFDMRSPLSSDLVTLLMPENRPIRHLAMQDGVITAWAMVSIYDESENRTFLVAGTGQEVVSAKYQYIGTVMDRQFVWHVFEEKSL